MSPKEMTPASVVPAGVFYWGSGYQLPMISMSFSL